MQIQREPTRGDSILDLSYTNKPGMVKTTTTIPVVSAHDIIVVDSDIRP